MESMVAMEVGAVTHLMEMVAKHIEVAHKGCRLKIDWLDGENLVVNCEVSEAEGCDAVKADAISACLGEVCASILNEFYPCDGTNEVWHCHSEPNYWAKDGGEYEIGDGTAVEDGDIVQHQIYCERY